MDYFKLILYNKEPLKFLEILKRSTIKSTPKVKQFLLMSDYRCAEAQNNFNELSFFVVENNTVKNMILAQRTHNLIGYDGGGIKVLGELYDKKILKKIFNHLLKILDSKKCDALKLDEANLENILTPLGNEAYNYKFTPHLKLKIEIDLKNSNETIFSSYRKSYKNLIKKTNINFKKISSKSLNKAEFDNFRRFHKKVYGRQTRPLKTWEVHYEMIESGNAELIVGYLNNHGLVSSALFVDYVFKTIYAVGVYERSLFDISLAHPTVHQGILSAKERGQKIFSFNGIEPYQNDQEKLYNIGKFKKGFSKEMMPYIEWNLNLKGKN